MNVISVGEVLWDIVGQEEHIGGATFNFSSHLRRLGHEVSFISAVGADQRGQRILEKMHEFGLATDFIRTDEAHPTGAVSVELASDGQPKFVLHRPAAYDFPQLSADQFERLFSRPVDWIYFGTLHQMYPQTRGLTAQLLNHPSAARRFYDVNLRANSYSPELLKDLMSRANFVKLNHEEVAVIGRMFGTHHQSLEEFCRDYAALYKWDGVCVTRGSVGCAVLMNGQYLEAAGYAVQVADTVGAGDAFAAAFLHGLGNGWPVPDIADFANRVGALVASKPGAIPGWTVAEAKSLRPKAAPIRERLEIA